MEHGPQEISPTSAVGVMAELGIPGITQEVEVGRGGFGTVYRGVEDELGRVVAVKVLPIGLGQRDRDRFDRERRAMGSLSGHPNIVIVHRTGFTSAGAPFIVMEFLERGSMEDRLRREGPVPWPEAVGIGVALAGAVHTAHLTGILHRDIKPGNVLISSRGEPKLGDFGIARLEGAPETSSSVITASIVHAGPEIIDGRRPIPASDLYSLASTVYTLIAGRPAFQSSTDQSIVPLLARIAREPLPDLRGHGVPDGIWTSLATAMAKDPADRQSTVEDFGRELAAGLDRSAGDDASSGPGAAVPQTMVVAPPAPMDSPGQTGPPGSAAPGPTGPPGSPPPPPGQGLASLPPPPSSAQSPRPAAPPATPPVHLAGPPPGSTALPPPGSTAGSPALPPPGSPPAPPPAPVPGPPPGSSAAPPPVPPPGAGSALGHAGPPGAGATGPRRRRRRGILLAGGVVVVLVVVIVGVSALLTASGSAALPETSGDDYPNYLNTFDASGAIQLSLPEAWSDIDLGGSALRATISAAPDLEVALNSYDGPGALVTVNPEPMVDADAALDELVDSSGCRDRGRADYDDGLYAGRFQQLTDCGRAGADVWVVVAGPADRSFTVVVSIQALDARDESAARRLLDSFTVETRAVPGS